MAYSKQTWDTTSYITPTRMNHIEDGIESAGSSVLFTVNESGTSRTAVSFLNELYTKLSELSGETVIDGYIEWGGVVYHCSRKDSGDYMFESAQLSISQSATSFQISVLYVASSSSKFERISVNMSTGSISPLDLSNESFNARMNFIGKTINETNSN